MLELVTWIALFLKSETYLLLLFLFSCVQHCSRCRLDLDEGPDYDKETEITNESFYYGGGYFETNTTTLRQYLDYIYYYGQTGKRK